MSIIAKKYAIILLLIGYKYSAVSGCEAYYKLSMHIIHSENHDQEKWKRCTVLISSLAEECQRTEHDTSAKAFNESQQEAIKTIKKIYSLSSPEKKLPITIDVSSAKVPMPNKGLLILFQYTIAQSTSDENKSLSEN